MYYYAKRSCTTCNVATHVRLVLIREVTMYMSSCFTLSCFLIMSPSFLFALTTQWRQRLNGFIDTTLTFTSVCAYMFRLTCTFHLHCICSHASEWQALTSVTWKTKLLRCFLFYIKRRHIIMSRPRNSYISLSSADGLWVDEQFEKQPRSLWANISLLINSYKAKQLCWQL